MRPICPRKRWYKCNMHFKGYPEYIIAKGLINELHNVSWCILPHTSPRLIKPMIFLCVSLSPFDYVCINYLTYNLIVSFLISVIGYGDASHIVLEKIISISMMAPQLKEHTIFFRNHLAWISSGNGLSPSFHAFHRYNALIQVKHIFYALLPKLPNKGNDQLQ